MNERHERIEQLAGRWIEARTTPAEERELRELLRREADLPDSLRDLALLFEGFEALAAERMPDAQRAGVDSDAALPDTKPAEGDSVLASPDAKPVDTLPGRLSTDGREAAGQSVGHLRGELRHRRRTLWWVAAAAAAVVVGILLGVELLRTPYCYIDGRPVYDREVALQATAYFDSFAALDAPQQLLDELIENK